MKDLTDQFGFEHGVFLNDFEANAYGLLETKKGSYFNVTGVKRTPMERMFIVGAGTGLGQCLLVPKPSTLEPSEFDQTTDYLIPPKEQELYLIQPGEGGHVTFGARNKFEMGYLKFIQLKYGKQQICIEEAWCGRAIQNMYEYIAEKEYQITEEDESFLKELKDGKKQNFQNEDDKINFLIISKGISGKDEECKRVVDFLLELYADEVSNIGIRNLSYGGIFMFGSLSKSLLQVIKRKEKDCPFMKGYYNKNFLRETLEQIPVYVLDNDDLGLDGAVIKGKELIRKFYQY